MGKGGKIKPLRGAHAHRKRPARGRWACDPRTLALATKAVALPAARSGRGDEASTRPGSRGSSFRCHRSECARSRRATRKPRSSSVPRRKVNRSAASEHHLPASVAGETETQTGSCTVVAQEHSSPIPRTCLPRLPCGGALPVGGRVFAPRRSRTGRARDLGRASSPKPAGQRRGGRKTSREPKGKGKVGEREPKRATALASASRPLSRTSGGAPEGTGSHPSLFSFGTRLGAEPRRAASAEHVARTVCVEKVAFARRPLPTRPRWLRARKRARRKKRATWQRAIRGMARKTHNPRAAAGRGGATYRGEGGPSRGPPFFLRWGDRRPPIASRQGVVESCVSLAPVFLPTVAPKSAGLRSRSPRTKKVRAQHGTYLVDPASSYMLVSKIKPCRSKYRPYTAKLRMAH